MIVLNFNMYIIMTLSLLLNVAVLFPVCIGLKTNANWEQARYGAPMPARGILNSIYLKSSFCLFTVSLFSQSNAARNAAACYRASGFIEEGRLRSQLWSAGKFVDEVDMGILKEEWEKRSE